MKSDDITIYSENTYTCNIQTKELLIGEIFAVNVCEIENAVWYAALADLALKSPFVDNIGDFQHIMNCV